MKKKLLSALMFGALIVASGSLTSCKDYDDDIQANTEQIQKLTRANARRRFRQLLRITHLRLLLLRLTCKLLSTKKPTLPQ